MKVNYIPNIHNSSFAVEKNNKYIIKKINENISRNKSNNLNKKIKFIEIFL